MIVFLSLCFSFCHLILLSDAFAGQRQSGEMLLELILEQQTLVLL